MGPGGGQINLQPRGDGRWIVEDPRGTSLFLREDGDFVGNLDRGGLTAYPGIVAKLQNSPFRLKANALPGGADLT